MSSFKALMIMGIWTAVIGYGLFTVGAHEHYRDPQWAIGIGIILLITHMVNMTIYFKVAGERPFEWFK